MEVPFNILTLFKESSVTDCKEKSIIIAVVHPISISVLHRLKVYPVSENTLDRKTEIVYKSGLLKYALALIDNFSEF